MNVTNEDETNVPKIILLIVMGPCGCGKTTIAQWLANRFCNNKYVEGDDFHSKNNLQKMSNGIPLDDEDRFPWLNSIRQYCSEKALKIKNEQHQTDDLIIVSCSSLKKSYRNCFRQIPNIDQTIFIYLKGTPELIIKRMMERKGHFMKASMLQSQFDVLESPENEIDVITIDIDQPIETITEQIIKLTLDKFGLVLMSKFI